MIPEWGSDSRRRRPHRSRRRALAGTRSATGLQTGPSCPGRRARPQWSRRLRPLPRPRGPPRRPRCRARSPGRDRLQGRAAAARDLPADPAAPALAFVVQEFLERFVHAGDVPWTTASSLRSSSGSHFSSCSRWPLSCSPGRWTQPRTRSGKRWPLCPGQPFRPSSPFQSAPSRLRAPPARARVRRTSTALPSRPWFPLAAAHAASSEGAA